jgi:hypothetical protein
LIETRPGPENARDRVVTYSSLAASDIPREEPKIVISVPFANGKNLNCGFETMKVDQILCIALYGYPLGLYTVLLLTPLLAPLQTKINSSSTHKKHRTASIWFLEVILVLSLVSLPHDKTLVSVDSASSLLVLSSLYPPFCPIYDKIITFIPKKLT